MGRSNLIPLYKMLDNVSMATSQTSGDSVVSHINIAQIIIDWSGATPVGSITVEAKMKNGGGNLVESPWVTVDFGTPILISGNTGQHSLIFNEIPFERIRITYNATSGTGNLTAYLTAKMIGG